MSLSITLGLYIGMSIKLSGFAVPNTAFRNKAFVRQYQACFVIFLNHKSWTNLPHTSPCPQ